MEPLHTNINDNNLTENLEKNLKQNEMVHIAKNILEENDIDSDLNEYNNEIEQQIGGNGQQSDENEQQSSENGQVIENEQQNGEIDIETSENRKSADKNSENEETLPVEVKLEEDDAFSSYSDGSHVFRKYRFRQRDNRPDYTQTEIPHFPIKSRTRYEHQDSFDCDQCPKTFNSRQGLLNHIRKHIADKNIKYTCALCSEEFDTNNKLIEHKIIHKDMMFTCEKCQLAFTDHCEFLEHEIKHTLRSFYKCIECGKFYNKSAILLHYRYHFDRRIECETCHAMIKKGNMKSHLTNHKLRKCVECDQLIRPDTMSYHMIRHTGFKPYQCLYCGKGFSTSQQRIIHTRTHTNERPFQCEICHQKFKQYSDLNRHKQSHLEKQYECNVCNKKFIHKESLITHVTIHNNTQRFKCEICNMALSTPAGYKTHMIYKHSDDKVFHCNFCESSFKTKVALNKHFRSLVHRRNVCKKQFKDEEDS